MTDLVKSSRCIIRSLTFSTLFYIEDNVLNVSGFYFILKIKSANIAKNRDCVKKYVG